jgi:2-polyprenyl-3-methyl-5-hydroxy-6-metoxy-1,4-benzoquinol methylase
LYDTPGRFKVEVVDLEPNLGHLRFTIDTPADLEQARAIYTHFENRDDFSFEELVAANQTHPQWQESVRSVQHKGYKDVDERIAMLPKAELLTCPLCESTDNKIVEKPESFGFPLTYHICRTCGFVFQDASTAKASDPKFYEDTYRKIYQTTEEPTVKDLRQQRLRAEHLVSFLRANRADHPRRMLDVGASSGLLLETFRDTLKTEVVGVEPGKAYRALAESKGISMFESLDSLRDLQTERFSMVSLIHVLEHLEDPVGVLSQIKSDLLHPEGWLLLEVPNFYSHDSYELAHLACFTVHTLTEAVKKAGYREVTTKVHGWPRSETLGLYITMLAKPDPLARADYQVLPEKHVAIYRRMGLLARIVQTKLNPTTAWLPMEDN